MPKRVTILACATLMCLWATGVNAFLIYDLQSFAAFPEFAVTLSPPAPVVPPPVLPETVFSPVPVDSDNNTVTDPSLTVIDPILQEKDPVSTGPIQDSNGPAAPVPEPSAIILLGAGLGALAIWKRKKQQ